MFMTHRGYVSLGALLMVTGCSAHDSRPLAETATGWATDAGRFRLIVLMELRGDWGRVNVV